MQQALEKYIETMLGRYVEQDKSHKVHVGVFSGEFSLENVKVKKDVLREELGLEVVDGSIEKLEISLPWQNILRGKLRVKLKGLKLELKQMETKTPVEVWKTKRDLVNAKKGVFKELIESILKPETLTAGVIANLVQRLVRNTTVVVQDVDLALTTIDGAKMHMTLDRMEIKSAIEEEAGEKLKLLDKILEIRDFGVSIGDREVVAPVTLKLRVRHSFRTNKAEVFVESAIEGGVRLDERQFKDLKKFMKNLIDLVQPKTLERLRREDLRDDIFTATQARGVFEEYVDLYSKNMTGVEISQDERARLHELFLRLPLDLVAKWEYDIEKVASPGVMGGVAGSGGVVGELVARPEGGRSGFGPGTMAKAAISTIRGWFSRGPSEAEDAEHQAREVDFEKIRQKLRAAMEEATSNQEAASTDLTAIAGLTLNVKLGALNLVLVRDGMEMLQAALAGFDLEAAIGRSAEFDTAQVEITTRSISVDFFGERVLNFLGETGSGIAQKLKVFVKNAVATSKKSIRMEFKAMPLVVHLAAGLVKSVLDFFEVKLGGEQEDEEDEWIQELAESEEGDLSEEEKSILEEASEKRRKKLEAIATQLQSELAGIAISIDLAGPIFRISLKNGEVVELSSGRLCVEAPELTEAIDLKFMQTGLKIGSVPMLSPDSVLSCAVRPQDKRIDLTVNEEVELSVDLQRTVQATMEVIQFVQTEVESIFPPAPPQSPKSPRNADFSEGETAPDQALAVTEAVAKVVGGWALSVHQVQTTLKVRQCRGAEALVVQASLADLKLQEIAGTWEGHVASIKAKAFTENSVEPVLEHTEISLNFTLSSSGVMAKVQASETVALNFWPELLDLFMGADSAGSIKNLVNGCTRTPVEILPVDVFDRVTESLMLEPGTSFVESCHEDGTGCVPARFCLRNPFTTSQTEIMEFGKIEQGSGVVQYTTDRQLGFRLEKKIGSATVTVLPLLRVVNYTPLSVVVKFHHARLELELKAFTAEDIFETMDVCDEDELVEMSVEFSTAATERKRFDLPIRSVKRRSFRLDLSPSSAIVAQVPLDVTLEQGQLSFSVAKLLRDETGLNLELVADDTPLALVETDVFRWTSETITRKSWLQGAAAITAAGERLWLLPEDVRSVRLYEGKKCCKVELPLQGFWSELATPSEGSTLVCRAEAQEGGTNVTMFRLMAKYRVINDLSHELAVTLASGGVLFLKPSECAAVPSAPVALAAGREGGVPTRIRVEDEFAGSWAVDLGTPMRGTSIRAIVARLDIAPRDGVTHLTLKDKAKFVVKNMLTARCRPARAGAEAVEVLVEGSSFLVYPGEEQRVGWKQAFETEADFLLLRLPFSPTPVTVKVMFGSEKSKLRTAREKHVEEPIAVCWLGGGRVSCGATGIEVELVRREEALEVQVRRQPKNAKKRWSAFAVERKFSVEVDIGKLGFSYCGKLAGQRRREILYAEIDLLRVLLEDIEGTLQKLDLVVGEVQVETGLEQRRDRPVIFSNVGKEPFLRTSLQRVIGGTAVDNVLMVKEASVALDNLLIDVDDSVLLAVAQSLQASLRKFVDPQSLKKSLTKPGLWKLGKIMLSQNLTDEKSSVPLVLAINRLNVAAVKIRLWVDFDYASMDFIPASLGVTLRLMSFSGSFQLLGARVGLDEKQLGVYRGPLVQYAQFLVAEYQMDVLKSMASILGKSSLLNVPRLPIAAVGIVSSAGFKSVSFAMDAVGGALNELVLDDEYKRKQRELRDRKDITSLRQGVKEAGKRTVEVVEGLFDIFRQPVLGAKQGGVGGFIEGVGRGLVGTIVKPVSKVGEAVSDLGAGVSKFASRADPSSSRPQIFRVRLPRPFYGSEETIDEYDKFDALVFEILEGCPAAAKPDAVLRFPSGLEEPDKFGVLALHSRRLLYLEVAENLHAEIYWEVVVSLLNKVKVEGEHLILSDVRDSVCRCRLPESKPLAQTLVEVLKRGIKNRIFDWRSLRRQHRGSGQQAVASK